MSLIIRLSEMKFLYMYFKKFIFFSWVNHSHKQIKLKPAHFLCTKHIR